MRVSQTMMKFAFTALGIGWFAATVFAADELGARTVWDALQVPAAKWQTGEGVSVDVNKVGVTIRAVGVDFGWAAAPDFLPVTETTAMDLTVKQVTNGQLAVQLEWMREDGGFIGATNAFSGIRAGVSLNNRKIAEFFPEGERPKRFRFKFWLEGADAEAQLSRAVVTFKRAWRKPETRLIKTYDSYATVTPDAGTKVQALGDTLAASLGADSQYSGFVFEDKVAYDKKGLVLLDVAALQDGVLSLQVLCWGKEGAFLKAVDLLKDNAAVGVFEVPLAIRTDDFPDAVSKISFKVWLSGKESTARIAGLYYGIAP